MAVSTDTSATEGRAKHLLFSAMPLPDFKLLWEIVPLKNILHCLRCERLGVFAGPFPDKQMRQVSGQSVDSSGALPGSQHTCAGDS